ncbi:carboxylesterase family protein [Frankia sp. AgB1.9]|uniref:carboxylesterase/lipase family protein n=1 Tax=unclassified Frankia TaxID=2632575 RepID=UPI0019336E6E|nr:MULTISPECIES: carboxylesterase family protein [unclassified Frankia]MBL7490115.1 carboxylesterase family protein [Frankia sp. AgW1.1]MBL7553246.1 carboxylesterase family protein [Frankia sp. AgB1.9]MBL7625453.1 carboxylesterase family protein [Frankia sp. AgB1.8]
MTITGALGSAAAGSGFEVRAAGGRLRGSREPGVAVFRGIPFAEPPVGELRFAAPRPAPGWDGVRPAVSYGPPAPQTDVIGEAPAEAGDDWLTVNVWSPEPDPAAKLAVLVWIYGGAYTFGVASRPEFDGGRLAREGGVVVVTFNYRLGIEGFAQIEGAPSNRGLLDQVAALEWVRDNITAFGGDPDRVTVFGESAGAGSVAALLAMPRAAGLFRAAVAQSAPGTFFSTELAADIAAACADELGLAPTAAELAAVDPALLALAGDAVTATIMEQARRWGQPARRSILFAPVVDGDVLPATPWQALAAGASRAVALLAGHTRDEQRLFTAMSGLLGEVTPEQADTALQDFAPGPDGARRYRDAYPEASPDQLYELVHSDWLFRMPTLHLAEAQVAGGGRAHVYELAWSAPGMGGALGACHGLDVPLVFGNLTGSQPAMLIGEPTTPEAETLSARMRSAWTSFAMDGDPGWPAYEPERRLTQVFDAPSVVTAYPEERSRLIWQHHSFPVLTLAGE